jgi:CDP-diacylglycerol--glycerol-3-phosphate 3-phosphatidyltransferase
MANAITVARVIALFGLVYLLYTGTATTAAWVAIGIAVVIMADALDGWVARKRGETTQFGAIFDIVGDRIVEVALWVVFADLNLIPVWVPLLVIARGFLVDGLRSASYSEGMTPFGKNNMMRSKFTEWLTAGRFMRAFFGGAKMFGFMFLAGLWGYGLDSAPGTIIESWYSADLFRWIGWFLVWSAVALTVIRAIPVVVDSVGYINEKDARERAAAKS